MKTLFHLVIFLVSTALTSVHAKDNQNSFMLGNWKIEATKYGKEPLLPAWMSFVGEAEFNKDESFHIWMQSQSDPFGRITSIRGTWSFEDNSLTLKNKETGESVTVSTEHKSDVMIIKGVEPYPEDLHLKREVNTDQNQVEGLRIDYMISFPKEWTLYTPDMVDVVPQGQKTSLEEYKCRAVAISPDETAQVMLTVSSRHNSFEELDIKSNSTAESLGITTIQIGGREWRIQKVRTLDSPVYGFIASTYHNYKTIKLVFHFHQDYVNAKSTFDYVLNSFTLFGSEENNDLKYGTYTNHTCGKPVFYHCGPSAKSYMHFLYSDISCPHCGEIWPRSNNEELHP